MPRCRAAAASQREKNFYAQRPLPCGPPFGRPPGGDHARMPGNIRKPAAEKKKASVRRHPPHRGIRSIQGECSPPLNAQTGRHPTNPASRARRRSPRSGSAAAGAHIARNAGRCAPTAPCGERQSRYTTYGSAALRHADKGSTGVVGGVEGHAPLTPCPSPGGDHAQMPGSSRKPAAEKRKKKENRPPRQASSVSRTTSRMSGNLRISSMS